MKHIVSIMSVGALACLSAMTAINVSSDDMENVALNSTVTVSSNEGTATAITDGDNGTSWQANAGTHALTQDWVIIDLGEPKRFTDMSIAWEASHCHSYTIYLSSEEAIPYTVHEEDTEAGTPRYCTIDQEWLEAWTPFIVRTDDTEANYTDKFNFATQEARYILIYANEYNNFGSQYGMRIFNVEVLNIADRDKVAQLDIVQEGTAVADGPAIGVKINPLNKVGEVLDYSSISNVRLTANSEDVDIFYHEEDGSFAVTASKHGRYTLTASAEADGKTLTAEATLNVAFNWEGIANVATGKAIRGRVKADAEIENTPALAVDGDNATYYQYNGELDGGDSWLLIDLGDVYNVEAIGAAYSNEGTTGSCTFGYATDATAIQAKIEAEGTDFKWAADLAENEGWSFTPQLSRQADAVVTYTYDKAVIARYIVVKDYDNPGGKPCVNEIYVAGTKREAAKASAISLNIEKAGMVLGETSEVSASVVDQYGSPFEADVEISVEGARYADGVITAEAKGMVTVTARAGDIEEKATLAVADEDDYCMAGAEVTASEGSPADTKAVLDGGKGVNENGAFYIISENESAGAHEHWVMARLAKPYDLDLIAVLWEGACPADYDIYLGESEDNLSLYYSQRDKEGLHNYNDRFSGLEMKNIQYIKVVTTRNATGYGIKMFDLKAYGTSNVASVPTAIEVSASDNDVVTGTEVGLSTTVLDQFGAEMTEETVAYSCASTDAVINGNLFRASAVGTYTVTATCGEVNADVEIRVVADAKTLMTTAMLANTTSLDGTVLEGTNLFAGNEVQITSLPATLTIEFDEARDFDLLNIRWEAACPSDYTVVAKYDDNSEATVFTVSDRPFVNGLNPVDKIVGDNAAGAMEDKAAVAGHANLKAVKSLTFNITAKGHDYNIRLFGIDAYGPVPVGIGDIAGENSRNADVYNMSGMRILRNASAGNLPKGIYITGGHKVIR